MLVGSSFFISSALMTTLSGSSSMAVMAVSATQYIAASAVTEGRVLEALATQILSAMTVEERALKMTTEVVAAVRVAM